MAHDEPMSTCLFCAIAAGDIPATLVAENDTVVAFADIDPQAPTHVLVIPRRHVPTVAELCALDPDALVAMTTMATEVAEAAGLSNGYRMVINTGDDGGQTVSHVHTHVLGGRPMQWPPG